MTLQPLTHRAAQFDTQRIQHPCRGGQYALVLSGKNAADPTAANSLRGSAPQAGAQFMPFYAIPEVNSYRMYFDRRDEPKPLW